MVQIERTLWYPKSRWINQLFSEIWRISKYYSLWILWSQFGIMLCSKRCRNSLNNKNYPRESLKIATWLTPGENTEYPLEYENASSRGSCGVNGLYADIGLSLLIIMTFLNVSVTSVTQGSSILSIEASKYSNKFNDYKVPALFAVSLFYKNFESNM